MKVHKNEVLKTYETDISLTGDNDNFKAHMGRVVTPCDNTGASGRATASWKTGLENALI